MCTDRWQGPTCNCWARDLGPATEPAFGVFHQTPLLQIVPGGQLVVHWSYREVKSKRGHLPHIAPIKGSLHHVSPCCPLTLLWLLDRPGDSVLFHFSPPFLVNHSGSGWWARQGPFWQVVPSNCMTVRLGRTSHFFERQLGYYTSISFCARNFLPDLSMAWLRRSCCPRSYWASTVFLSWRVCTLPRWTLVAVAGSYSCCRGQPMTALEEGPAIFWCIG